MSLIETQIPAPSHKYRKVASPRASSKNAISDKFLLEKGDVLLTLSPVPAEQHIQSRGTVRQRDPSPAALQAHTRRPSKPSGLGYALGPGAARAVTVVTARQAAAPRQAEHRQHGAAPLPGTPAGRPTQSTPNQTNTSASLQRGKETVCSY